MQVLYAQSRDKERPFSKTLAYYQNTIHNSFELYLFNLYQWLEVVKYAQTDSKKRKVKHRPTDQDKSFQPKLFDNDLTATLISNPGLRELFSKHKLKAKGSEDAPRQLYIDFSKTEEYQEYLQQETSTADDHRKILLALYKQCASNEIFDELMDDHYLSWTDDRSLVVGAVKKTIKALPVAPDFFQEYRPPDEAVKEFGETLLKKVVNDVDQLLEHIEPTLKNWDAERVAVIDMILLKMAVCELINFPTIPTKVTLNEFVEISKLYSTDKSKDFINGILDRLMKKLEKDGKIVKEGRGLLG